MAVGALCVCLFCVREREATHFWRGERTEELYGMSAVVAEMYLNQPRLGYVNRIRGKFNPLRVFLAFGLLKCVCFYIIGVSQRVQCCSGLVSGSFAIGSTVV